MCTTEKKKLPVVQKAIRVEILKRFCYIPYQSTKCFDCVAYLLVTVFKFGYDAVQLLGFHFLTARDPLQIMVTSARF